MFTTFSASPATPYLRACDTCRKLKIKCRNVRPLDHHPCDQCRQARLKCTYRDQPASRGRPRQQNGIKREYASLAKVIDMGSPVLATDKPTPRNYQTTPSSSPSQTCDKGADSVDQIHHAATHPLRRVPETCTQLSPPASDSPALLGNDPCPPNQCSSTDFPVPSGIPGRALQGLDAQHPQDIWDLVYEFFNTVYIIFPVISYVELTSRLIMETGWATSPDLRTLLYAMRLWIAAANYRIELQSEMELRELISHVETSRLAYDFADPATLDAVACSLCLFTAYNVMGKHNRAFLYLEEASFLLEAVTPSSDAEEERRLRIEKVLFNTESAALPLYATKQVRRRARRPPARWEQSSPEQDILGMDVGTERVAMHLLRRLTQIHLAQDADDLSGISVKSEADMENLFGTGVLRQHRYSRIQSADVVMTHQWQLSCKLIASGENGSAARNLAGSAIDTLGVAAMSWICVLREGDLRVVGLGKLAGLTMNIYKLGGMRKYQDVLRGLAGAVMREDHEGHYSLPLAELILPTIQTVPRSVPSQGDSNYGHDTRRLGIECPNSYIDLESGAESGAAQHDDSQWETSDVANICDTDDWLSYLA
ncbi:hypothetical protein G7046_g5166 [Stylonectria norvegica]|nr:hypothetical protein G7046_g5166 [Stylonectria norvegica]